MKGRYVVSLGEVSRGDVSLVGGKGANLGELQRAGFPVPAGFSVVAEAYDEFLRVNQFEPEIRAILSEADFDDLDQVVKKTGEIRDLLISGTLPPELRHQICEAYGRLGEDCSVAVRSSSAVPSKRISSFPGQMDTFYDVVGAAAVLDAVKRCWASFWTARASANRWNHGIDHFEVKVCAVVQVMVPSEFSGVAFTANPVTGDDELLIEAVPGMGEALVSGRITPELFVLAKDTLAVVKEPEGPKIPCDLIRKVADVARRVEMHYGQPQDIEWSFAKGELYVLQTREIRGIAGGDVNYVGLERWNKPPEQDEAEIIWTRAWSDEVLTRAITPLFYSVQADLITATYDFIYRCYGLTDLLPLKLMRFHKNRAYFSTKYLLECLRYVPAFARSEDALKFFTPEQKEEARRIPFQVGKKLASEARLLLRHRKYSLTHCYKTYYEEWLPELLQRVKELDGLDLNSASLEELYRYFRGMERLIKEHCQPIGFGVMVHTFGAVTLLEACLDKWCERREALGNLLSGLPGNQTVEFNKQTWQFTQRIRESPLLTAIFVRHSTSEIPARLQESQEGHRFLQEVLEYAKRYEFRGAEDRDIVFPRWGDDPGLLIDMLKILLDSSQENEPRALEQRNIAQREKVTEEIRQSLVRQRWGYFKRKAFDALLKYAQVYSLFRENQRYEVDRVFYGERKAFLAIGRRLVQKGVLSELDDVWYLSKEEVFDAMRGEMSAAEVQSLVVPRKKEFRRYVHQSPPIFLQGNREFEAEPAARAAAVGESRVLKGLASSCGTATGTARVVRSLRELTRVRRGDILVTNSTDPGWTPVFLLIRGLVLETGGILAHGTVLSREYGLPAVTAVKGATRLVKDGQLITVNGTQGTVTLGAREQEQGSERENTAVVAEENLQSHGDA